MVAIAGRLGIGDVEEVGVEVVQVRLDEMEFERYGCIRVCTLLQYPPRWDRQASGGVCRSSRESYGEEDEWQQKGTHLQGG